MRKYIIRRLLLTLPTLFILTLIIFMTVHFIPGDVIDGILADWQLVDRIVIDREALERKLGLDKPVVVQYAIWMRDILFEGTLGTSLFGGWEVEDKILERLPGSRADPLRDVSLLPVEPAQRAVEVDVGGVEEAETRHVW